MRKLTVLLSMAAAIGALTLLQQPGEAATWRYSGAPGSGPPCGFSQGNDHICDPLICESPGFTCSSAVFFEIGTGKMVCICSDTSPGC